MAWAEFRDEGPFPTPRRVRGAKAAGLAYERKVHRHLREVYSPEAGGPLYAPAQWIEFVERGSTSRRRWAQPDGLLVNLDKGLVTIVETKLRHTDRAWWWLRQIYLPLLRHIFPAGWTFALLEVVRYYDPAVHFPEPTKLVKYPDRLCEGQFGVHIWSGRV